MHEVDPVVTGWIANFMHDLNESAFPSLAPWSMRDVRKLFQQIDAMQERFLDFQNMTIPHQIMYYVVSGVPFDLKTNVLKKMLTLIQRSFKMKDIDIHDLENFFRAIPTRDNDENRTYLMKRKCGIRISTTYAKLLSIAMELHSVWDANFNIALAHHKEPLLLQDISRHLNSASFCFYVEPRHQSRSIPWFH
jgi:hypothetical protein